MGVKRLLGLLALWPMAAAAQTDDPAEIVVTGRGLADAPGDAAYDIVTLDRDRILDSTSGRLEDVLRDVAGLQQFRRSDSRTANPTSQGITLRGLGGNASSRALLLLDGVPQADPFGGWVAFPAYATDRLGRVRITRGGGSGVVGPGALAGTIELDSARPDDLSPLTAMLAGGSRASVDTRAGTALVRGSGFATFSGAYARGDGFVPVVAEDRGPADRPAPFEQASAAARAVIEIAPATEFQANISGFTDRRDRGLDFTDNRSEGADASVRLVGRGRIPWSALAYLQTRAFASRFASVGAGRATTALTLDQYNVPAIGRGGRVEVAPTFGPVTARIGGDLRIVEGETQELYTYVAGSPTRRRVAGGRNATAGAFADVSVVLGQVTLSAGGRIDRWRIADGRLTERPLAGGTLTDQRFADRSGWQPTGRAGVAWLADDAVTVRVAGYRGWRLPTLNELYRPFRVGADATAANAMLAPETMWGGEVGIDLRPADRVRIAATAFANDLRDGIANVSVANGPGTFPGVGFVSAAGVYRQRANLDHVRVRGVELDGEARFGAFEARLSYAYSDAVVRDAGLLDGLRPAQTPAHSATASFGWRRSDWALVATGRYVGPQFEDDANSRRLNDATTLDLVARAPLTRRVRLEARAENLTDTRIEAAIGGDGVVERASPRTFWLALRFEG
ncbi:TonB-dependent receptor [Sphingomonas sp. Leaf407]|uniref:TonB-dependent receptor n=1 Tax=unclassified Sphingomonas TaxID=196159 RepID=UPI0006F6D575|nr:TonB-dependent receptor [Sphingomonas sp. Leaf42]KQT27835.1 TonB-dependent receptor [Sphingomonas sp. Leaf407]